MKQKSLISRARYSTIAPPHSYLNVDDYPSPKALAQDIKRISSDPYEYLSYFWWKTEYRVTSGPDNWFATWCDLCAKLNDPMEPEKVFNGLDKVAKCDKPNWFSAT